MKSKSLRMLLLLCIGMMTQLSFSQSNPNMELKYEEEWKAIQDFESKGLPESALKATRELYVKVKADGDTPQLVKVLIYLNKFQSQLEEDGFVNSIRRLEAEMEAAEFPLKPILQSMLAQMYQSYLSDNSWKIRNRTETTEEEVDDLQTWSMDRIADRSFDLYWASLEPERDLLAIPIEDYDVITTGEKETDRLRPSLFDLLAHRAIDHFRNERSYLTRPAEQFSINDKAAFWDANVFANHEFTTTDTISHKYQTTLLFQKLIRLHLADEDPAALIDVDLARLKFLYGHAELEQKDQHYLAALQRMKEKYEGTAFTAEISYAIADLYRKQADRYAPSYLDEIRPPKEEEKWGYRKAVAISEEVARAHPDTYGGKKAQSLVNQLLSPSFELQVEQVNLPEKPILSQVRFKNVEKLFFKIVQLNWEDYRDLGVMYDQERIYKFLNRRKSLRTWEQKLPRTSDHHYHTVELAMEALPFGFYSILITDQAEFDVEKGRISFVNMQVSNISFFKRDQRQDGVEFLAIHRETGAPMPGVNASFYRTEYRRGNKAKVISLGQKLTDQDGLVRPDKNDFTNLYVKFSKGEDQLFLTGAYGYYNYGRPQVPEPRPGCEFFLDRAIYRPGQTIHYKGLLYSREVDKTVRILPNERVKVTLYDVNGQDVASQELVANEYGTVSGQFEAPKTGLLGGMSLRSSIGGHQGFRVEEYKRPKFEVEVLPFDQVYALEDTVSVKGTAKAYAGNNIDGAKVSYSVERSIVFPWRPYYFRSFGPPPGNRGSTVLAKGETVTDANGQFELAFVAKTAPKTEGWGRPMFVYKINVDVTDITGETHSSSRVLNLSEVGIRLSLYAPKTYDKGEALSIPVNTTNLDNQFVERACTLLVEHLNAVERPLITRYWSRPDLHLHDAQEFRSLFPQYAYKLEGLSEQMAVRDVVFESNFTSEENQRISIETKNWPVGEYRIRLLTKDDNGNELEEVTFFKVYDSEKSAIPASIDLLVKTNQKSYKVGEKAGIQLFAGAETPMNVFFTVGRENSVFQRKWISVANRDSSEHTIVEADKGGVFYQYLYVKNNRQFMQTSKIAVPWSDKQLKLEMLTFRDKLKPGQEEEWQIKISGTEKDKVAAELVATMYDASLDVFAVNFWDFNPYEQNYPGNLGWQAPFFSSVNASSLFYNQTFPPGSFVGDRFYRELRWFDLLYAGRSRRGGRVAMMQRSMAAPMEDSYSVELDSIEEEAEADGISEKNAAGGLPAPPPPPPPEPTVPQTGEGAAPAIRTNLDETVFFFPQLQTDEAGNIILKFKMNEALTRWKFLAFAHTEDLELGSLAKEVVTQKELMIQPNAPRFLREGDAITFTAKVSNITEGPISGTATLELFDALSMQPVDQKFAHEQRDLPFSTEAGQSAPLAWKLSIPKGGLSAVTYRVVAKSERFGDGEESALPILPNRMMVTESMPISLRGKQSRTFSFEGLKESGSSKSLQHHKLTLEFSSNPAWYAVQALPYLMEFPHECTEQLLNRYYANALASAVVGDQPAIRDLFESWKGTDALLSNLSKNEELKAVLLEETPWVMQAQSEEQQKQNIALLFDLNRMASEKAVAIDKLYQRQMPSGGFSWFPGGRESWYITQYLVEGFGHLKQLGAEEANINLASQMVGKAIGFIDEEAIEYHERIENQVSKGLAKWEDDHLSALIIHYLYTRSFYLSESALSEKTQKVYDYFSGQAEKYWLEKSLYQQALIGLAASRNGRETFVNQITKSLKERALKSDELGMYWKSPRGYLWHQLPIETHTALLELFAEATSDQQTVEELKIWLLKNKQTNHWKTTKATAAAVHALFSYGDNWLEASKPVKIAFQQAEKASFSDRIEAAQRDSEPGTGYFKTDWDGEEVSPKLHEVKIKNPNKTIAWGSLYWQYFEDLDRINPFEETPLRIKKKLYKSVYTETGPILTDIDQTSLTPGDKVIVRIELRVDRDMEYIHMKDQRASGFEPINVLSSYKWQGGLGYYESTKDVATHFFIDFLPKGTYVFEYPLRVNHQGNFSNGITTIQSMYAPEFGSHSEGVRVEIGQ